MLSFEIKQYKEYTMIGQVFVKNGVNFLYGESGIGKTVSTIKALNEDNIQPILLDFDDNLSPSRTSTDFIHINGNEFVSQLVKFLQTEDDKYSVELPNDRVIIVDTYKLFEPLHEQLLSLKDSRNKDIGINILDYLKDRNNTVIIIGHVVDLASKRDIPDAPSEFVNHCSSKLFLDYQSTTIDKIKVKVPTLNIKKLRGYKGNKVIYNWMRSD